MTSRNPNRKRGYPYKRIMKRKIRRIAFMVIAAAIAGGVNYYNTHYKNQSSSNTNTSTASSKNTNNRSAGNESSRSQQQAVDKIRKAVGNSHSQFWVTVQGKVFKLLKDDLKGSRHKKF